MDWFLLLAVLLSGLVVGIIVGGRIEAKEWRDAAYSTGRARRSGGWIWHVCPDVRGCPEGREPRASDEEFYAGW